MPQPAAAPTPSRDHATLDATLIDSMVRAFYDKVRRDPLIGPIFEARITEWEPHLRQMIAFWSAIAHGNGGYSGNPMAKHIELPVDGRHFRRWLSLFEETAFEICPPSAALYFIDRAQRIAQSLQLGIAVHTGTELKRGDSLQRPDGEVFLP